MDQQPSVQMFARAARSLAAAPLEARGPAVTGNVTDVAPFWSKGRPSVDPELLLMGLIVRYCCGIRSERRPRSIRQARCTSKHGGFPFYAYATNHLKATAPVHR